MPWITEKASPISAERLDSIVRETVVQAKRRLCASPRRVLLLPPDITRMHSGAGHITQRLYEQFEGQAEVHLIPTLGQHQPHTREENRQMFGSIPQERIHAHDWRAGCVQVGELSAEQLRQASGGAADWPMPIVLNKMLIDDPWDLVIHIGHVVPHEVLGFANHNKNYFIGLGGKPLICAAHMMAASCGIENNLAQLITPVRQCFNEAEDRYLDHLPDLYVQVVMDRDVDGQLVHSGVYVGDDLETYLAAARQSRDQNVTILDEPIQKVVCLMQGDEFFSTWVANKAVYRTRMAVADGGELVIMAPGLKRFGEQADVDALIRKYGYAPSEQVLALYRDNADMQDLAHATAHLMHGTTEGRFAVTYAPGHLGRDEVEGVHYRYADLADTMSRYPPDRLSEGYNRLPDGEQIYFIATPAAGLWSIREKLYNRPGGFGQ